MTIIKKISTIISAVFISACTNTVQESHAQLVQTGNESIRLNQIGFYPDAPKKAVIVGEPKTDVFYVFTVNVRDTVYSSTLGEQRSSFYTSKTTYIADFSALDEEGTYIVAVPGIGTSYAFDIGPAIHQELAKAAIKGFYFQRTAIDLTKQYADKWARPAGHPDTLVLIHSSAATRQRPAGTVISAPLGWYDAGDYNKYIVNSGITMGTLLSLYEDFPDYFNPISLSIPESENQLPDVLDEVLWNLRWMLAMQDPDDGGVYHKLTTANFEGMIMPGDAKATRYVVQKSTSATLDFAAVMAQSSRVFSNFETELPGLADSCLKAATSAWEWAVKNPAELYNQSVLNKAHDPDVTTGAYGDGDVSDEFAWAAAELWIATGEDQYLDHVNLFPEENMPLPSWGQVRSLGYYSLLRHKEKLEKNHPRKLSELKTRLISFASMLAKTVPENAYATMMGGSEKDFVWGSNAVAANQGIAFVQAYLLTRDQKYLEHALANLDYLLGRNATGYSFVTGYGDKTPLHPHHRPSVADGLAAPVPGLLVGGPNPGQQDGCEYTSKVPGESYVDADCSYASNEIAINWNAPLAYLAGAIEALQQEL